MDAKDFIQGIIDNELGGCFADCAQDNIDKMVEIVKRYHAEQLRLAGVVKSLPSEIEVGRAMSELSEMADKEEER